MKPCIFVAAGDISDRYCSLLMGLEPRPFVFAVDGGYEYLKKHGFHEDMALGDFDSLGFIPEGEKTAIYPVRKDKPDMQLAVDAALEMGFDSAYVLGAFGGERLDHTYANFQTLLYALPGLHMLIFDDHAFCMALNSEKVEITAEMLEIKNKGTDSPVATMPQSLVEALEPRKAYLSLFAADQAQVDIEGCSYDGKGIELVNNFPLGVSNYITESKAVITVEKRVFLMLSGRHKNDA